LLQQVPQLLLQRLLLQLLSLPLPQQSSLQLLWLQLLQWWLLLPQLWSQPQLSHLQLQQ
jgi:hypothetical protein